MPVDASIYSQLQPAQAPNPLAALAQAYQIKALQTQADREQRAEEQQNRLLQLVGGADFQGLDTQGKAARLQGIGAFDQAGKLIQSAAAANKDQRAADSSAFDMKVKQLDALSNLAGSVTDQTSYDRARQIAGSQLGIDVSSWSPQYNPAGVQQFAQATLSAKDRLLAQQKSMDQSITMRGQDLTAQTSRANNADTNATAQRGQDLTDARSREAMDAGRVPSGYRRAADGVTLEFIPGGPADPNTKPAGGKPLNDTQAKALQFGTRMQIANEELDALAAQGTEQPGLIKRAADKVGAGMAANWTQSAPQQRVEQAQRDFINAVLRRESGAAIAESEFNNARQQYFPQPGDTPEVIAQKKQNREVAMRGILAEVPDAETRVAQVRGSAKPAAQAGAPMSVTNAADYAKVPSGATYTTPDGKTRRKP